MLESLPRRGWWRGAAADIVSKIPGIRIPVAAVLMQVSDILPSILAILVEFMQVLAQPLPVAGADVLTDLSFVLVDLSLIMRDLPFILMDFALVAPELLPIPPHLFDILLDCVTVLPPRGLRLLPLVRGPARDAPRPTEDDTDKHPDPDVTRSSIHDALLQESLTPVAH